MQPADSSTAAPRHAIAQPTPEYPDADQIKAYGAFTFLYLRSRRHQPYPLAHYRMVLQPAIDLRFFRIHEVEGVPRAGLTWAFLGPEAEAKLFRGQMIAPSDWVSGSQIWIMEVIAPYGQGLGADMVRRFLAQVTDPANTVRFVRYDPPGTLKHVTEYRRGQNGRWGKTRLLPADLHPETLSDRTN